MALGKSHFFGIEARAFNGEKIEEEKKKRRRREEEEEKRRREKEEEIHVWNISFVWKFGNPPLYKLGRKNPI